jgi:hypothetical protein
MRRPSTPDERWGWWERAAVGEPVECFEDDPNCGFFKVRRFAYGQWAKGPFVPARIWIDPVEIDDETGELLGPEIIRAEIDGRRADPFKVWTWLAANPITEEEYQWLTALSPLLPKKLPSKSGKAGR